MNWFTEFEGNILDRFDLYFADYATCPWQNDGVTACRMWIGGQ